MGIDKPDVRNVMEFQREYYHGLKNLEGQGEMVNRLLQQYCTTEVTYHMLMLGYGVTVGINNTFLLSWQYVEAHLAGVCRRKLLLRK